MGLICLGGGSYNWVGALTWNLSCVTSLSKVMRIAQNGAKNNLSVLKTRGAVGNQDGGKTINLCL